MKKLLILLTLLTISGTTMPMVVAAAPHQKTNNLETLKRNKRQNINLENNEEFEVLFEKINILSYKILKIILDNDENCFYVLLTTKRNNTNQQWIETYLYKSSNFSNTLIHSETSYDQHHKPPLKFNDFSLDKNKNIYMSTDEGIWKYDNKIDKKTKISDIRTEKIAVDNEGNTIFKRKESDFLYYLKNDEKFPINESEANLLRKISFSSFSGGSPIKVSSINFDSFNNIYIETMYSLFLIFKYDTNPQKISGEFSNINFFNFNKKNYLFNRDDGKLKYMRSGQTTAEEINTSKINDFYLDKNNENFYLATERGIFKLNIENNKLKKINDIKTKKISIDKSNNIYFFNSGYLNIIKDDKVYKILSSEGSDIYPYPVNENEYTKIINSDKSILLFQENEHDLYRAYYLNRKNSWINNEEKQNDEIEEKAKKIEEERKDKEREEWAGTEGKRREKEWKINKLKEIEEYLKEKEQQGKATPLEIKLLACFKKHIPDGFALGFGVLGGIIGTAVAPGGGTVVGSVIGTAVGKWIGGIVGDAIKETVPGEESCKFD